MKDIQNLENMVNIQYVISVPVEINMEYVNCMRPLRAGALRRNAYYPPRTSAERTKRSAAPVFR
jgi:hypothetical protein